jgi:hypothetical protein
MPKEVHPPETFLPKEARAHIVDLLAPILSRRKIAALLDEADKALLEYWVSNFLEEYELPRRPGIPVDDALKAMRVLTRAVSGMGELVAKRMFRHLGINVSQDKHPLTREDTGRKAYIDCLRPMVLALRYTKGRTARMRNSVYKRMYTQLLFDLACIWEGPLKWRQYDPDGILREDQAGTAFIIEVLIAAKKHAKGDPTLREVAKLRLPTEPTMRGILREREAVPTRNRGKLSGLNHSGGRASKMRKPELERLADRIWAASPGES